MSDKKLLEESTIRRFMKLANITQEGNGLLSEGVGTPFDKKVAKKSGHSIKVNGRKPGKGLVKESDRYEEMADGMSAMTEEEDTMDTDPMGGMEDVGMGADLDMDAGGGDTKSKVEDAVESLKNALNDILDAVGSDKQVEEEPAEEEGGEEDALGEPEDEEAALEEEYMEEDALEEKKEMPAFLKKKHGKKEEEKEELEEELEESIELVDDDLIETLLQRVTARLVKEAKNKGYKGHGAGVSQGAPFNKSATHSSKNSTSVNARKSTKSVNSRKR